MSYDAFISYSRSRSTPLAVALQQGIERYSKPWNKLRAARVFRDDASMSANAALWPTIERALREAQWFILIATPDAASSEYVNKEVAWWVAHKGCERLLLVHAGGAIGWAPSGDFSVDSTALPPAVRRAFSQEPRWIDLTWFDAPGSLGTADPRFVERLVDLAAPIQGKERDEIIGSNARQHRKTRRITRAAIVMLSTLLVLTVAAGTVAFVQREEAVRQRDLAISRQLVVESRNLLDSDPQLARLMVVAAARIAPDSERARALSALRATIAEPGRLAWDLPSGAFAISDRLVAAGRQDGSIHLLDTGTGDHRGTLQGHTGSIQALAFSGDSNRLTSGSVDGSVRIWDVTNQQELHRMNQPNGAVWLTRLNAPGDLVLGAAGGDPGPRRMTIWAVEPGAELWHIEGAESMAFDSDGESVVVGFPDGSLQIRNARSGVVISSADAGPSSASVVAFGVDDTAIMSASTEGGINVLSPNGGRLRPPIAIEAIQNTPIAFGHHRPILVTGGRDGIVRIWDADKATEPRQFPGDGGSVDVVALGMQDTIAASGSIDGRIRLWNTVTGLSIGEIGSHQGAINALAFDPTGHTLVSNSSDGTVRTWSISPMVSRALAEDTTATQYPRISADGRVLATGGSTVRTWSPDGTALETFARSRIPTLAADVLSPDGSLLATTVDGKMRIFDTVTKQLVSRINSVNGKPPLTALAFSPGGETVATADNEAIQLWRTETGELLNSYPSDNTHAGAVFDPSGRTLAISTNNEVVLVDLTSLEQTTTFPAPERHVDVLAFSPDGSRLVLSGERTIEILDRESGDVTSLAGHTSSIFTAGFNIDGTVLATAGNDRVVRLWDPTTGEALTTIEGVHSDTIRGVAFQHDGTLVSIADDLIAARYETQELTAADPVAVACEQAGRPLSAEERNLILPSYNGIAVCE